ncbi:hypothetical protein MSAN_02484000 [Mycena sanguinolenta]|uniref:Zn(2)-C6 fungal-type domain-containing protein n=1 Tax=Mycena sanguinolenta TaxID=230812 RepID=A0A8H6U505_9AGAR|nr:hypothetical protein MSAN_02484000 [Mycena sanguinolenta]
MHTCLVCPVYSCASTCDPEPTYALDQHHSIMEQRDNRQLNTYAQPPAQFYRRHTQPTQPNLVYPPVHLFRHESTDVHGSDQNMTLNPPPAAATTVFASHTAELSGAASQTPIFSENRGGFFCFSIGTGTPLPYGRACTRCKKAKVKCVFEPDELANESCRRCRAGGQVCTIPERKQRDPERMPEYLTEQIRQKDRVVESLLKQLQNRYVSTLPSMVASPSNTTICGSRTNLHGRGPDLWFKELPDNDQGSDEGEEDRGTDVNADLLPIASAPLGLIAESSLNYNRHGTRNREPEDLDESVVGVANMAYFQPGPATDSRMRAHLLEQSVPEIVIHGIVVPEDVDKLFEIFHANLNPFISLLDPVLHTPTSTFARCPVLFTVVCAVSSRYYTEKSEIYPIAMQFAKRSAANALNEGRKTIELCQAYLLLSIYAAPVVNWEQDCSWLFTGVAIRLATDLNLHQESISTAAQANEKWERELLNRTRVWMTCFVMDHLIATESGKPPAIKPDDVMRCRSNDWYSRSPYNSVYDLHLCVTTGLQLIIADFQDQIFSLSGLNQARLSTVLFTPILMAHRRTSTSERRMGLSLGSTVECDRCVLAKICMWSLILALDLAPTWQFKSFAFLTTYSQLFMFSFALEQAYRTGFQSMDELLFTKCLESAKNVLRSIIDGSGPSGFVRYCPHGHFTIVAFASAVLLKLLRPEFSHFMPGYEETQVYSLITQVIQTLSSSAVDDRHIPKLYAHFLDGLLSHHHRDSPALEHWGPSSSNYGDLSPASSMFTMSSFFGGGTGADSEQEIYEYQDVYQRAQTALIPIHYPIGMSTTIQHNAEMELGTEPYNELV